MLNNGRRKCVQRPKYLRENQFPFICWFLIWSAARVNGAIRRKVESSRKNFCGNKPQTLQCLVNRECNEPQTLQCLENLARYCMSYVLKQPSTLQCLRVSLVLLQPGLGSRRKIDDSDSTLFEIKIIYLNINMFLNYILIAINNYIYLYVCATVRK